MALSNNRKMKFENLEDRRLMTANFYIDLDYGVLTILKQDDVGGFQVKMRSQWIDAPPVPNSFVCNIGDMLDRLTRGLYRSTPHGVQSVSGRSRLSFPTSRSHSRRRLGPCSSWLRLTVISPPATSIFIVTRRSTSCNVRSVRV